MNQITWWFTTHFSLKTYSKTNGPCLKIVFAKIDLKFWNDPFIERKCFFSYALYLHKSCLFFTEMSPHMTSLFVCSNAAAPLCHPRPRNHQVRVLLAQERTWHRCNWADCRWVPAGWNPSGPPARPCSMGPSCCCCGFSTEPPCDATRTCDTGRSGKWPRTGGIGSALPGRKREKSS